MLYVNMIRMCKHEQVKIGKHGQSWNGMEKDSKYNITRCHGMNYTTTTCITMKMMELFNYANIQKLPGYRVFVSLEKEHQTGRS